MHRRRLCAALLSVLVIGGSVPPGVASAQATEDPRVATFTLDPVGDGTVTGLAILAPRDADTTVNVLAVGAPAGSIAVIHGGTCAAIDPTPVGLVGDVGTTGQVAATIPVPFAVVADGAHVLALHPGLDLATTIACGAIPLVATSATPGPGPSAAPPPTAAPTPAPPTAAPSPEPTADTAGAGVEAWVTATLARFDAVKAMAEGLATAMNAGMAAYAQTLADDALAIQRLQIEQQQVAVPGSATDAQTAVIDMLRKLAEAYDLMAQAYSTGNMTVLQQGLSAASEAQALATAARSAVRQVATPCGITVPAV
ncbi:MAG: hypothetical protein IT304_13265 [Dehalococcoidia bacterium]|nr:hypothetical protein [Dehalococcoidia bacterium]